MKAKEQVNELLEAKRRLYVALLSVPPGDMTLVEIELAFNLCQDSQIQELIEQRLGMEKRAATFAAARPNPSSA